MSFDTLPTELYDAIFCHVSASELQYTVLAVTRAIPLAAVPLQNLFRSLRLTRPEQTILLYNRIRPRNAYTTKVSSENTNANLANFQQPVEWVKELAVETWSVDADVLINLVRLLPNLQSLTIWVGPNNFSPEHLEELLSKPIADLRYLSLRFRPYVEKVTYYQFLKGAYFDSTLTALSLWPPISLTTFSIVQDPLNPEIAQRQDFAQPIVFFRLDLLSLLNSPAISNLQYLRIRIPSRPVARALCGSSSSAFDSNHTANLPNLEFLDLSTCSILDAEIDTILARFATIKHIILDRCAVLRGDLREGEGNALGKRLALIGVRRAKDREKTLKAWLESKAISDAIGSDGAPAVDQEANQAARRPRRGRRGLATATISFRTPDVPVPVAPSIPGKVSPSKKNKKAVITKSAKQGMAKIRVLPTFPSLSSLSLTLSSAIKPERYPAIQAEFEEGWAEGIAQLAVTRARLRTSAGNGYRVMRIYPTDADNEEDVEPGSLEEGLYGLEDVDRADPDAYGMPDEDGGAKLLPPTLCFAGPGTEGVHAANCGHSIGWEIMKDEI